MITSSTTSRDIVELPRGVDFLMNAPVDDEIINKAMMLVCMVQDEASITPRSTGKSIITYKINSNAFLDRIRKAIRIIDEITWVRILKFLRESKEFKDYYEFLLRVPFEHDGGSKMFFPEVYSSSEKVLVRLLVDIKDASVFYPNIPGIKDRIWKKGDAVYVPEDKASIYLKARWMEKIE